MTTICQATIRWILHRRAKTSRKRRATRKELENTNANIVTRSWPPRKVCDGMYRCISLRPSQLLARFVGKSVQVRLVSFSIRKRISRKRRYRASICVISVVRYTQAIRPSPTTCELTPALSHMCARHVTAVSRPRQAWRITFVFTQATSHLCVTYVAPHLLSAQLFADI